jgi:hypothetical protein
MADPVKLSTIVTRIQRLADMENATDFVSTTFIKDLVNQSLAELIDLLRSHFGQEYHRKSHALSIVSGTRSYPLPSDFLALLYAEMELSTSDTRRIHPYTIHTASHARTLHGLDPIFYRIGERGSSNARMIDFLPSPTASHTINIYYIPTAPQLVNDDDTFDAVNGWEDYIVWDVVAALLAKEESDMSYAIGKRESIKRRIESLAGATDQGSPEVIGDVQSHHFEPPYA